MIKTAVILFSCLAFAAGGTGLPRPAESSALSPSLKALEDLATRAVERLNGMDSAGLFRLSVNREEFLAVYSFFEPDTSSDRREFACGFFLTDNAKILRRTLGREGGMNFVFSRLTVDGPVEDYGPTRLYRGIKIWVRSGGIERELRFFKSAAKMDSAWKIWSFADD